MTSVKQLQEELEKLENTKEENDKKRELNKKIKELRRSASKNLLKNLLTLLFTGSYKTFKAIGDVMLNMGEGMLKSITNPQPAQQPQQFVKVKQTKLNKNQPKEEDYLDWVMKI